MATGGMSRRPLLRFVKLAKKVARAEPPRYSHRFASHRYSQAQLCACCLLAVRAGGSRGQQQ